MNDVVSDTIPANVFDRWQSIAVAIFMALVGYTVMVSVPVLSTALVDKVGFSEEQVGRIWGADLGGLSLGAILSAMLVARMNRRTLVFIGVALSIGANALCMVFTDYEMVLALRVLAGIGSGIFTAVAVVTLGGTTNPVFAYNLELLGFGVFHRVGIAIFAVVIDERNLPVFYRFERRLCSVGFLDSGQASQYRRARPTGDQANRP